MKNSVVEPRQSILNAAEQSTDAKKANYCFWYTISDQDGVAKDVKIDNLILIELLYDNNYRRYDLENESIFVKLTQNRIIKYASITEMQDFIFDYIDKLPEDLENEGNGRIRQLIKRKVLQGVNNYFNEKKLYLLKSKEDIKLNKDTIDTKYIYFQNGYLEIKRASIKLMSYKSLSGYIWEKEIINREFTLPKDDEKRNYVKRFFELVAGANRYKDLCIAAGYYIHDFYDYKLKALILTDSSISENNEANGRTGKTLFCKLLAGALSSDPNDTTIKTYCEINAKDFDAKEKHKYGAASLETKLIVLNDLRRNFDVDTIYNDVTDGITVDKKGLQPFKIRCKIILTTNKTIRLQGDSDLDRFLEFEFSNYFSAAHTPENEFKHWFFRDWNNEDFCRYYYFLAECCQMYFANNLKLNQPLQINLNKRKLKEQTSPEFLEWIENKNIVSGQKYVKSELYKEFIEAAPDFNTPAFKQRRFAEWLKAYLDYSDEWLNYNKQDNEPRDSNTKYFVFLRK